MARKEAPFINREIAWLSFNSRVLQEAGDHRVPLIERLRFLGIFSNNRDEFFRIRVATITRMLKLGKKAIGILGEKPDLLLNKIQRIVVEQENRFESIYNEILMELAHENIYILDEFTVNEDQGKFIKDYFHRKVRPVLVPIMLDRIRDFPHLNGKAIYLAVKMKNTARPENTSYSLLEIPSDTLGRFLILPSTEGKKFIVLLDDVIRYTLPDLFSIFHFDLFEAYTIKVTRDAELDFERDISKSLLEKISESVKGRQKGSPVRFVYDQDMPEDLLYFLTKKLKFRNRDHIIPGGRYHNFKDFMKFPNIGSRHLEHTPTPPLPHPDLNHYESILEVLEKKDVLLAPPYHSFDYFIDLLREAAIHPTVREIKLTLYRVAGRSAVINALKNAAQNGKKVTVIVELKARFDEEANIYWANELQDMGVKVIFGVEGLKVHSKICLITAYKHKKTYSYGSIGTGNFNENTAKVFSDHHLLTTDQRITNDLRKVFEFLERNYLIHSYRHLIDAPINMRNRLLWLINNEIQNIEQGKEAWIFLKLNNLVDRMMIEKLYDASQAGVKIKLIVRGICSLVPGVKGFSENIEAISIVDKFLEHSRIFVFCNDNQELYFLSSGDWMTRNLDYRIETTVRIYEPAIQAEIRKMLDIQWLDNEKARVLEGNLKNAYRPKARKDPSVRSQITYYQYLRDQLVNKKD